jgi:putative hemolysin
VDLFTLLVFFSILALSGLFSGSETALTAVSEVNVSRLADQGNARARLVIALMRERGRVIATLLVANNVVNVVLAVFATVIFDGMLRDAGALPAWASPVVASIASVAFLLVFGEVLPKTVAVTYRVRWALAAAYPTRWLLVALNPVTWLLIRLSNGVLRMFGRRPGDEDIFDIGELHAMAKMSEQAGVIDPMEKEIVQRAAELNDTRVREIMIPRTDIQGIEVGVTGDQIRQLFQATPFTRIPVYKGDLDDVLGVLNAKEFFRHDPGRERRFDLTAYLHRPLFVPGSMFIGDLLNEMRERRTHLAIVLDEYGGTAGMITLEDVVERLVGRIDDEYDAAVVPLEQVAKDTWELDGRVTDERLVETLGIQLPPEEVADFDTVAGLALKAFGNIPAQGQKTTYHGLEITAAQVQGNRVLRVRVRVLPPEEAAAAAAESGRRRPTDRLTASRGTAGASKGDGDDDRKQKVTAATGDPHA